MAAEYVATSSELNCVENVTDAILVTVRGWFSHKNNRNQKACQWQMSDL